MSITKYHESHYVGVLDNPLIIITEFQKLPWQLQRKRHIKIELCIRLSALRLSHVAHVKYVKCPFT